MKRSALGLPFAVAIAASVLLSCASPLRPAITVYTKRDFGGVRETLHDPYPSLARHLPAFEDEISSFEIHRGVWELCKRPGYRDCRIADRSMPDLGAWDLDNAISSLRAIDVDERDRYDEDDRYEDRYDDELDEKIEEEVEEQLEER